MTGPDGKSDGGHWWGETQQATWGGMPVVHRLADAAPRRRVVATGTIFSATVAVNGESHAYHCVLDDGTGQITLIFPGRKDIPGLVAGACCTVEGTAREEGGHLVLWNPLYELVRVRR